MPWYAIVLIVWYSIAALIHVAGIGKNIELTAGGAVITLITSALTIWAIAALAAH
jgi:hypothetical protein